MKDKLHINYEEIEPWPLEWIENSSERLTYKVPEKMKLSKARTSLAVNSSLTLAGIPGEAFAYRLGNRSAVEWLIDQYQVTEDPRTRLLHLPSNREGFGDITSDLLTSPSNF